ncbi:MAG: hypothetical protein SNJ77_03955 [Cytophagales bacterium]
MFDLKWDEHLQSVQFTQALNGSWDTAYAYVPCIFIENLLFTKLDTPQLAQLSVSVAEKLKFYASQWSFDEVQIDCDWNQTTKEQYFLFLEKLSKHNWEVSSTIRLHQIKFKEKSGIPPVKKGYLMCYNMGNIKRIDERNSIFDFEEMKSYLANLEDYPMSLDIALPIFSWSVLFRKGEFKSISIDKMDFNNPEKFKKLKVNMFECLKSHKTSKTVILRGDQLRFEEVDVMQIAKAVSFFNDINPKFRFVFFDLNESNLNRLNALTF